MKSLIRFYVVLFLIIFTFPSYANNNLWTKFQNPPSDTRTKLWWFHGETVTTEEGIDADLEAFKEAGIGGVVFYDQMHGTGEGAFDSMSPEWWHMLKYAARKAKSLGLSFEVAASNGYVAGGPWITPELGMQKVTVIDTVLHLNEKQELKIDLSHSDPHFRPITTLLFPEPSDFPEFILEPYSLKLLDNEEAVFTLDAGSPVEVSTISYTTNPRGKGSTGSMNIPGDPQEKYFGALYTELPPVGTLEFSIDGEQWNKAVELPAVESVIGHKSRERTVSFPAVKGRYYRVHLHDWVDKEGKFNNLQVENVRLSTRDYVDNWQVKSGLRTEVTYPRPEGGNHGAIDPASVKDITPLTDSNGELKISLEPGNWHILRLGHVPTGGRTKHGRKNLLGLEADVLSTEAATLHFNNYFKVICDSLAAIGCKPIGMCMDSHEAGIQNWTPGFEKQFAQLRGYDLLPWMPVLGGYIVMDRAESERVLRDFRRTIAETIADNFYGTLAALCHSEGVTFTSQAMLNIDNDNIMSRSRADKPQGEFWAYQLNGNFDCLDAASTAHLYGRQIASGEAFTDTPYGPTWDELLRIANLAYCRGINEFAVCASTYQPWLDHKYNDDDTAHPYVFHRLHPEWSTVGPFWEYQARCATLLREGQPVVDLCVYIGEDLPGKTFAYKLPVIPEGYNFDVCTRDALLNRVTSGDGELKVKGGMNYKALVVQDRTYLSLEVLERIEQLEREGVPVVWCNRGEQLAEKLPALGIQPDFGVISANRPDDRITFFHRRADDADIYFVYNHSEHPFEAPVSLRTSFTEAEAWNPRKASHAPLYLTPEKELQLHLDPYESTFLIIR